MATSQDVTRFLKSVDFPASRDNIVEAAQQAAAPTDVLKAVRAVPPVDYGNKDETLRSADTDASPGEQPGHAAARARNKKHEGIARHIREP